MPPTRMLLGALAIVLLGNSASFAQLRIVTYNTATAQASGIQTARPGVDVVLEAIGAEIVGGIAKPIDVLILQEQYTTSTSTQSFVDLLNSIYGEGAYARSTFNGSTSTPTRDGGAPALVYRTSTVQLISEARIGVVGGYPNQARSTMRYQLRPNSYDESADFYVYNSHYKASTGADNELRRYLEAQRNRQNADALGEGSSIIYAGDFNIQSSSEDMYVELLSSGAGQAFDPINSPGSWNNNSSFKSIHTQSPRSSNGSNGLIGGGVDDRFDFQLVTGELLDNEGLSYISGSYHAFGNNGTHSCCGSSITTGTGASPAVLSALTTASDHLPVVADYQLPAVLETLTSAIPSTLNQGETFSLEVMVRNAADVMAAIGADELDYTLSVTGDLIGAASGSLLALAPAVTHLVAFDTTTPGMKSGLLTVSTDSQSAANALFELPVSYEVLADGLPGDFNEDGMVDAADYSVWRNGLSGGEYTLQDYQVWRQGYGQSQTGAASSNPVPSPGGVALLLAAAVCGASLPRGGRNSAFCEYCLKCRGKRFPAATRLVGCEEFNESFLRHGRFRPLLHVQAPRFFEESSNEKVQCSIATCGVSLRDVHSS